MFRERLFSVGYWFSFALPISLILWIMARFLIWGHWYYLIHNTNLVFGIIKLILARLKVIHHESGTT
jgi:hypothetical protein